TGADFDGERLCWTVFADTNLHEAQGLDSMRYYGNSIIGIDSLYRSGAKIPEAFLRGCGMPDQFITMIPSLIGVLDSIQFYSCFISYSAKDEDFAKRLFSRMRNEHLRVWFAPENMKSGQKI